MKLLLIREWKPLTSPKIEKVPKIKINRIEKVPKIEINLKQELNHKRANSSRRRKDQDQYCKSSF